jgi:hypothetical protein
LRGFKQENWWLNGDLIGKPTSFMGIEWDITTVYFMWCTLFFHMFMEDDDKPQDPPGVPYFQRNPKSEQHIC